MRLMSLLVLDCVSVFGMSVLSSCVVTVNGEGELRGQPASPGSPGKMAVKTVCVCFVTVEAKKVAE